MGVHGREPSSLAYELNKAVSGMAERYSPVLYDESHG